MEINVRRILSRSEKFDFFPVSAYKKNGQFLLKVTVKVARNSFFRFSTRWENAGKMDGKMPRLHKPAAVCLQ